MKETTMGIQANLGYEVSDTNALQRGLQQLVASKPGAWLFSKFLHAVDKPIFKMTGGKHTATSLLAGLPVIMLTTTGRKSGEPRTMPLLAIPVGSDLAVIGSNFGQETTPAWVYNLEADPAATVVYRGSDVAVAARRADDAESDATFDAASKVYPGYAKYRERVEHREIRVFVLESAG